MYVLYSRAVKDALRKGGKIEKVKKMKRLSLEKCLAQGKEIKAVSSLLVLKVRRACIFSACFQLEKITRIK